MKIKTTLSVLTILITTVAYGQISSDDEGKADFLINHFQDHTDSVRQLTDGARICYVSDTLFKAMILTLQKGDTIILDLKYKDNFRGYAALGADFDNYILIEVRGDGSGNPSMLRVINKNTGEDKWPGNYPFYINKVDEVIIYNESSDPSSEIVVHDFLTNKTETYPTPETNCRGGDCFEVVQIDSESFTIKFTDLNDKMTKLKIKRAKS
jgi:hypothetical protein